MFTEEEKKLVKEAVQVYAQMIGQQYGPTEMQGLIPVIKSIFSKMDSPDTGSTPTGSAPTGISDEWFQNVCRHCPKLNGSGCQDPVTAKWPGKCDPILTWERSKSAPQA